MSEAGSGDRVEAFLADILAAPDELAAVKRADTDVHVPIPDAAIADPAARALVEPAVSELLAAEPWRRA